MHSLVSAFFTQRDVFEMQPYCGVFFLVLSGVPLTE